MHVDHFIPDEALRTKKFLFKRVQVISDNVRAEILAFSFFLSFYLYLFIGYQLGSIQYRAFDQISKSMNVLK